MIHYKRILAVSLTASMLAGNSVVAWAADKEASASGSGEVEYVAVGDVFDVVFPTISAGATTFDYILDPDGLISATGGAKYTGKTFDDGKTVYFLRSTKVNGTVGGTAGTGNCDYTDSSDEMTVTNKSTQAVTLSVKAKVAAVDGITMANSTSMGTSEPELYLAVSGQGTDDAAAETTAITTAGVDITKTIPADDAAYEVKWSSTNSQYEKQLTTAASAAGYTGFKSYTFQLTGACNTHSDWATLKDKAPKVDLVWSVKDFTVTGPQISVSTSGLITVSNVTAEKNYKSIDITAPNGSKYDVNTNPVDWNVDNWSAENGGSITAQLGTDWMDWLVGAGGNITLTLNLSDNTTVTCTQTLTN